MNVRPVTLTGKVVRLEPLSQHHLSDLAVAGADPTIWRYMLYGDVSTPDAMQGFIDLLQKRQEAGTDLPFAVIHQESERAIGSTRYMEIRPAHRGLEIGGSWYAPSFQRTGVNTECKFLLLCHAFEALEALRVQLKTDVRNERSRQAIKRLGAVEEGIFRNHIITPGGEVRDSVYYSIIASEWPAVKERLLQMMASY